MSVQVQNCERFLDRRWTMSMTPGAPWWPRRAGYCQRCMGLAEATDHLGLWWHIDVDNLHECRSPEYAYKFTGTSKEARFVPDPNLQHSIMQAINEGKPKYGIKKDLRVGITQPQGFSHDAVCGCSPCQLLRDPRRRVPGEPGQVYVTHEEYSKLLRGEEINAAIEKTMRFSGHPPGCDCRGCDYAF